MFFVKPRYIYICGPTRLAIYSLAVCVRDWVSWKLLAELYTGHFGVNRHELGEPELVEARYEDMLRAILLNFV